PFRTIRLNQHGDDLVEVAHDAVVRDGEDRGRGIGVDGHDLVRFAHARAMLDGAGDAAGDVQLRPHRRAGLADLIVVVNVAGVHRRAAAGGRAAESFGQLHDQLEVLLAAHAGAAGDDDVGRGQVNLLGRADAFQHAQHEFAAVQLARNADDFSLALGVFFTQLHDAG